MKKIYIIALLIIAVGIGVILTSLSNTATYSNFKEAAENPDSEYHIVGKRDTSMKETYNPLQNPDIFEFYMIDQNGERKKVRLHKSKPQDFEKSEQIVVIGKMKEDNFEASDILMKCPSKYNDVTSK
ncbi:MAG: cytochrome c maturation protein CcmE [Bacteroidetes bacterium]|jgi:cytochrome c-type biogenesis protein CcmE|nr:MAG: cytochrome c maturation protein CcmE [Bacteroidota bacterium]